MKKLIFVGILGLFVLGSCNNSTVTHTHDEHDHAAEGHNHEAEGPDHSHEGECSGDCRHLSGCLPECPYPLRFRKGLFDRQPRAFLQQHQEQ